MKTAATIVACLSLLTCHFSTAQDTNQTARQRAAEVKHIDLNMELPDKLVINTEKGSELTKDAFAESEPLTPML